jgi:adenine-specific DNA-methyltransferase
MTDNQKKLMNILREMFQFDQSDLDFGIYRIMRMKRDEVNRFIEEDLPAQITAGLSELAGLDSAADIAAIDKQIADTKAAPLSDAIKAAAVAELEEKKKSLAESVDITAVEADVYNHLTNFFSRYYDEGDFISQRRYKDSVYAIPYEGEEVKLHWANADQYYVKTSEYFTDYTFKTMYGDTIRFKLIEADTERDNNKANEKRFFQLHTDKPFEVIDGELYIYVEYKNDGKKNQAECTAEIVSAFVAVQTQAEYQPFSAILTITDNKTLLERQLNRYTARNTFDYFIHKDLGKFLRRELDFYIKNDVIFLDDIDGQDEAKTKEYLTKATVIRKIARKIITFLAQIEDFQKKLYLKKKFVVETNYCITLDRVPEAMYPEIAANDAQRKEWVRLFTIDEIEGTDGNLVNAAALAYSVPLTVDFLKQNSFLVLDTAFFSTEFKERLVDSIDGLDEKLDGLMIHSDNYQAIRLLQQKYRSAIQYIYIDPPYNTDSTPILYKNGYRDSSWLSLMNTRLIESYKLLTERGIYTVAIDDTEVNRLTLLMEQVFPNCRISPITVVHNPKGSPTKDFNRTHEYAIFATGENVKNCIARILEENDTPRKMRRWGENSKRTERRLSFYPIYIKNNKIVDVGVVPEDNYHPTGKNEQCTDGRIAIWPIDQNGIERRWNFGLDTIRDNLDRVTIIEDEGVYDLFVTHEMTVPKTVWKGGEYDAGSYGNTLLTNILGTKSFDFPKSINTVVRCVRLATDNIKNGCVLDFFAGSGTTGHAVINLNRDDGGHRKYILVEMGEYFNTVTKPRIQKVIYSMDTDNQKGWKDGKPVSRKGTSHAFKYLRLESYEDALNNIVLSGGNYDLLSKAREGYMLSYMLGTEAAGSDSLLNVEKLNKPFSYKMNITRNLESAERIIDLVETFNYLIGLTVKKSHALVSYDADFATGEYGAVSAVLKAGDTYKFKAVEGTTPSGDKTLVLWREMTGDIVKDNAALDAYFLLLPNARSFRRIYVNCDNNLLNLRGDGESWQVVLIDEEMKKRMFEDAE